MGSLAFAGMGMAAEDITGEWYLGMMTSEEGSYSPSDFGMEITLTLNEDGTAQVDSMGSVVDGSWEADGDGWKLSADGELRMILDEEILVVTDASGSDDTVMQFSREKTEAPEASPVRADAALEDFNGTWNIDSLFMGSIRMPVDMFGESITRITIEDGVITYHSEMDSGDEEVGTYTTDFTVEGVFEDGVLSVESSEETDYTALKLQLHEDGTMSDGYTEPSEQEPESETEAESEDEEDFDFDFGSVYTVYVKE